MVTRLYPAAAASSLLLAYSAPGSAAKSLGVATLVVEKEAQRAAGRRPNRRKAADAAVTYRTSIGSGDDAAAHEPHGGLYP